MRTFPNFPNRSKCPICGTNNDEECFLAPIDGTVSENNEQAAPVHVDCMLKRARYNEAVGLIYVFVE